MKWNTVFFVVMLAFMVCEIKSEAKISDLKPFNAEQNFENIKKTMEISDKNLKKVFPDDDGQLELMDHEGSGWEGFLDDNDDDYEDEDYDEEYYDDEDEDENYEDIEGSGSDLFLDDYDDNDLDNVQHPEDHVKVIPDITDSDFIFEDGKNHQDKKDKKEDEAYDDLMYEYYNDLKYGDDDYDEDQYEEDLRQVEQDLKEIVTVTKFEVDSDLDTKSLFHPSYIFLMLSSALISFAVFTLAFILCRRSKRSQNKKQMVPFVVTSHDFSLPSTTKSSTPIVKNSYYTRVPTNSSPKELMPIQNNALEAVLTETQKPLLP